MTVEERKARRGWAHCKQMKMERRVEDLIDCCREGVGVVI